MKKFAVVLALSLAACVNPYLECLDGRGADCGVWALDESAHLRPIMGISPDGGRIVQIWRQP